MQDIVEIYTDGACRGNPGKGGWGALMKFRGVVKELYGGEPMTTNNRMELLAVIKALEALKKEGCQVQLNSDSKYVLNGIDQWMENWKKRGWKTSAKKPVLNQDLWQLLDNQVQRHTIEWRWVKGHSGNAGNDRADELANRGIDELPA